MRKRSLHARTIFFGGICAAILIPSVRLEGQPEATAIHGLRARGATLVEAEAYSAANEPYPYAEPCKKCSGQANLGFFWKDSWFEVTLRVPQDNVYQMSLRAASIEGTSIEVREAKPPSEANADNAQQSRRLGVVQVAKTGGWKQYAQTAPTTLKLAAGLHTLRFQNLGEGANVDYFTFSVDSPKIATTYRPTKTTGPDKNPLKGFGSGWWRPDDDYATVGFQYIEWGRLEPKDDHFDWAYLEEVLNRPGTRGRHLILQFVTDWDYREPVEENYVGPDWLLKQVGEHRGHADPNDPSSRAMRATKYNHPAYVAEATEAIVSLTDYFKDDPRVFVLQAGLLGFWSEWHTFPREDWSPSLATKSAILSAYRANLPNDTFTQMRYPNEPSIQPQPGVGYFNGSATLTQHGREFGQAVAAKSLWKLGPITGEWPPSVEKEHWQGFFQRNGGEQLIREGRYSTLLMPEHKEILSKLPTWTPEKRFMKMHRQLGYNLQVERVRHVVNAQRRVEIELTLGNVGIAPFYKDWQLQLAVIDSKTSKPVATVPLQTDLRKLAPGRTVALRGATSPPLDKTREYQIGLRVLQPGADRAKSKRWPLEARNVYVVLANDVPLVNGSWQKNHSLRGGWNLLGKVVFDPPPLEKDFFPFMGSAGPTANRKSTN